MEVRPALQAGREIYLPRDPTARNSLATVILVSGEESQCILWRLKSQEIKKKKKKRGRHDVKCQALPSCCPWCGDSWRRTAPDAHRQGSGVEPPLGEELAVPLLLAQPSREQSWAWASRESRWASDRGEVVHREELSADGSVDSWLSPSCAQTFCRMSSLLSSLGVFSSAFHC